MSKKYYFLNQELPSVTARKSKLRSLISRQDAGNVSVNYVDYYKAELFYYLSGIQVLTIRDKFGSALSNLLSIRPDLKNDDAELNADVKQTRLDAVKSCRYMIPFSAWIFDNDFDDDRTLDERRIAWIRQTMSQCESVSSSKMDVNSFIGGSERQKKYACKKRDEI